MIGIDEIIERLGGAAEAARLTGVGLEAIRKWRQAGAVPSKHWSAVSRASGLEIGLLAGRGERMDDENVAPEGATAVLVLADGSAIWGVGFGAFTEPGKPGIGEVCFSTGLTGYQETLTDPSFAGQIITFTFPHVGNVGTNRVDLEAENIAALGVVLRELPTEPSNWRSVEGLDPWLRKRGVPGIAGVDTRALTMRIQRRRDRRMGVLALSGKRSGSMSRRCRRKAAGLAGARRHGSGASGFLHANLRLGRDTLGLGLDGETVRGGRRVRSITSWRWIMAPRETSCVQLCQRAGASSPWCRRIPALPKTF